jgi:hypothetical protein
MDNCPEIVIDSAEYCDSEENKAAGFNDLSTVWMHDDVLTYPEYQIAADVPNGVTEMIAKATASAGIVMKTGKKPYKIPSILEKNGLQIQSMKGGWKSEAAIRIQNTAHNRGFIQALKGARFSFGMQPVDDDMVLLGQSNGLSAGYLAKIDPESVVIEFGNEFGSDKYIEFKVMATPKLPVIYKHIINYDPAA